MRLRIPVFVRRDEGGRYTLATLEDPLCTSEGPVLEHAKARLARDIAKALLKRPAASVARLAGRPRPRVEHPELLVEMRPPGGKKDQQRARFTLLSEAAPGGAPGRIVSVPAVPGLHVFVGPGEAASEKAARALGKRFAEDPEGLAAAAVARSEALHEVEVDVGAEAIVDRVEAEEEAPPGLFAGPTPGRRGRRSREELLRGETLLEVGMDLTAEAREGRLQRAFGRDAAVADVLRMLTSGETRAVLLVGEPGVGKTAVVHEVARRLAERQAQARDEVAPGAPHPPRLEGALVSVTAGRLVAGMRYVGQWEERAIDLAAEAEALRAVIHAESLLEIMGAGITQPGERTSVASLWRGRVERGEVAIVAEATPAALARAEAIDRPIVDLFTRVTLAEPSPAETLAISLKTVREVEAREKVAFELRAVRTALDLLRRFVPGQAFPGKGVRFLHRLAERTGGYRAPQLYPGHVLAAFASGHGVQYGILNDDAALKVESVRASLGTRVRGQPEAVTALADVVLRLKSGLQDPAKPLAALIFAGPSGVGKTESAKALAAQLFGSEERLTRFDLNEYADPGAPERLAGAPWAPEGELTRALRDRPLSVVLLDEVEKADPGVFDLLLQLLGEGRLTDALGRTADARNAVFILTTNLGAGAAERSLGFRPGRTSRGEGPVATSEGRGAQPLSAGGEADRAPPGPPRGREAPDPGDGEAEDRYVKAIEDFFRPELVNRIDRIVAFRPLGAETLREIASREVQALLSREGVQRRRLLLDLDRGLVDRLVADGASATEGARPLRRSIERRLGAPLAAALAARPGTADALVTIRPAPAPGDPHAVLVRVDEIPGLGPLEEKGPQADEVLPPEGLGHAAWARELEARFLALDRSAARRALSRSIVEAATAAPPDDGDGDADEAGREVGAGDAEAGEGRGSAGQPAAAGLAAGEGETAEQRAERIHRLEQELDLARREVRGLDLGRGRGGYEERIAWRPGKRVAGRIAIPELEMELVWTRTPPPFVERLSRAAVRLEKLERLVETALAPLERAVLQVRAVGAGSTDFAFELLNLYLTFARRYALSCEVVGLREEPQRSLYHRVEGTGEAALLLAAPGLHRLLAFEPGLHEMRPFGGDGRVQIARVRTAFLDEGEGPAAGLGRMEEDAAPHGVVRKYLLGEAIHDVALHRSALVTPSADGDDTIAEALGPAFERILVAALLEAHRAAEEAEAQHPPEGEGLEGEEGAGVEPEGGGPDGSGERGRDAADRAEHADEEEARRERDLGRYRARREGD